MKVLTPLDVKTVGKISPCIGESPEVIVNSNNKECQNIIQKTTLLVMHGKKRSVVETQRGNHENKSNGHDEVGETIHVKDYSAPSGDSPIHNHN
ncbi:hypothetical protein V2J09_001733 [Rumex salicifolius]